MHLHNRVNRKVLKEKLLQSGEKRTTLSFYKYFHISEPKVFRDQLYLDWSLLKIYGRIYVAKEGINGQLSVPDTKLQALSDYIDDHKDLKGIRLNIAIDDDGHSFYKLKIQIRNKIVADGLNDTSFDVTNRGGHLSASEFNTLADDPNTVIVDMRNHYESEIGHFQNAITPDVDTFRDSLPVVEKILQDKKDKNIVMYCTGGIRCEKASAYYKHKGFEKVYQLDGGIIEYARQVKDQSLENKFRGKNFVFDERLGERISEEIISQCHQCGRAADTHTNCKNDACHLLFIQCEACANKMDGCCSKECQQIIHLPIEEQAKRRKGIKKGQHIFKKGRSEKLPYKQ